MLRGVRIWRGRMSNRDREGRGGLLGIWSREEVPSGGRRQHGGQSLLGEGLLQKVPRDLRRCRECSVF